MKPYYHLSQNRNRITIPNLNCSNYLLVYSESFLDPKIKAMVPR